MKLKIEYSLTITERAFKPILEKFKTWHPMNIDWVNYDYETEDDEARVHIRFPNKKYPELTRQLFFEIVCTCYQKTWGSSFYIEAIIENEAGKEAIRIQDTFNDNIADYEGSFRYNGELFSEDLQRKITEIKNIIFDKE